MEKQENYGTANGLLRKLAEVMGEVGWIEKRGVNSFHGYNYVMESDVLEALREKLAKRKIFILTSVVSGKRTEIETQKGRTFLFDVELEHRIYDAETGENLCVRSMGTGIDNQDKAIFKAITGATKYFFTKNFLIPTGDDPENDHGQLPELPSGTKSTGKPKSEKTAPKKTADIQPASSIQSEKPEKKVHSELFSRFLDYMRHEKKRIGENGYYAVLKDFGVAHANEIGEEDELLQQGVYWQLKALHPNPEMGPESINTAKVKASDYVRQIVERSRA